MDSDSDGDLPSLSSILETLKKQRPTATFVRPQQSHIEDPAEEAIIPRSKDKARSSRLCPTSRTSSTSSIDDGTPSRSKASSSKSSATPSKQSTRSGSQSLLSAADVSARKARICRGETGGSSSNSTPSARSIGLSAMTDSTEHCPSDSITASSGCFASSMSEAQPCTTEPTIPIVVVELATTTMKSSMPDNAECAASSTSTLEYLPSKADRAISCTRERKSPVDKARRKRRITIITIPDSEDDVDQPPLPATSRSPSQTPSLEIENHSVDANELTEDVSFADYSDAEDEQAQAPVKKPAEAATQIIEIDSSDSDYDSAAGVIVWNPTPNKVKNIIKPSTAALSSLPIRGVDSTSSNSDPQRVLAPIAPSKSSKSQGGKAPLIDKRKTVSTAPATVSGARTPRKANGFVAQRDELATQLIEELNSTVFEGRLPDDLTVVWNGRLNTTAGRANWKKITNRTTATTSHRAEIELSVKVVDSEEKLKCTLSHELCHIAAWAIDKEMKPAHGPAFKFWGRKVMQTRRDIKVTTKHTYEIAYKYQWQCTDSHCGKVYGRHSKSIDPSRQACGACSSRLVRLGKDGLPMEGARGSAVTPRKENEWMAFSKVTFKRIKEEQPSLSMTQINKLVAAEWAEVKAKKASQTAAIQQLATELQGLAV